MSVNFITNKRSCLGCVHYETFPQDSIFIDEVQCTRTPTDNRWISEERKVPTLLALITNSCGKTGIHYKPNKEYAFKPNMEFLK